MRNQFFYSRIVRRKVEGTENIVESTYRDSFNLDMVIRSVTLENGQVVVLLNDVHEQIQQVPIMNSNNKPKGFKEVKGNVQSEITLSAEDGERFFNVSNVEHSCCNHAHKEMGDIVDKVVPEEDYKPANMSVVAEVVNPENK